jgi:hypothetical protein
MMRYSRIFLGSGVFTHLVALVFVVDEIGDHPEGDDFKHWAHGKQGQKVRPRIPLGKYTWFHELRARLADYAAGSSAIGPKTIAELDELVAEWDAG